MKFKWEYADGGTEFRTGLDLGLEKCFYLPSWGCTCLPSVPCSWAWPRDFIFSHQAYTFYPKRGGWSVCTVHRNLTSIYTWFSSGASSQVVTGKLLWSICISITFWDNGIKNSRYFFSYNFVTSLFLKKKVWVHLFCVSSFALETSNRNPQKL